MTDFFEHMKTNDPAENASGMSAQAKQDVLRRVKPSHRRGWRIAAVAAALGLIGASGVWIVQHQLQPDRVAVMTTPTPSSSLSKQPKPSNNAELEGQVGMVLTQADGKTYMCNVVLTSDPPQCEEIEIQGTPDWGTVKTQEHHGAKWSDEPVWIRGHFNADKTFTLTAPLSNDNVQEKSKSQVLKAFEGMPPLCDPGEEPSAAPSAEAIDDVLAHANQNPDVVAVKDRSGAGINVLTHGDKGEITRDLQKIWHGPLCVVRPNEDEYGDDVLARTQNELLESSLSLRVQEVTQYGTVLVVQVWAKDQATVDGIYQITDRENGRERIWIVGNLHPVS